jgi:hypothetical protein
MWYYAMSHDALRVEECVLLVAPPLNEESFSMGVAGDSEFLSSNRAKTWDDYTEKVNLGRARKVRGKIEQLDCRVVDNASFQDFISASTTYLAVGLVAHCAYKSLDEDDVLDPQAFMDLTLNGDSPELRMFREYATPRDLSTLRSTVRLLNTMCDGTHMDYHEKHESGLVSMFSDPESSAKPDLVRFDRPRLEELYGPSVLRSWKAVEFADGMRTTQDIIAALPLRHPLSLDLLLCISKHLGSAIRRHRPNVDSYVGDIELALPHALEIWGHNVLEIYLAEKAGKPIPYREAFIRVKRSLSNVRPEDKS